MRSCFIVLAFLLFCCSNGDNIIKPEVKPLMEAVYASGYVVAKDQYEVFAQAEGYVMEKVAQDGEEIRKNDPIYILESGQQSSRLTLAKKNYAIALDNYSDGSSALRELEATLKASESKMKFDSVNFRRYSNLLEKNATTKSDYDRIKLAYENSRNDFIAQQNRYRRTKNQMFLELENAKSQLAIAGNESGKYVVKSEIDGKVFKTLKEKGELVRRGEAVAIVGDKTNYYLELSVDEMDIQRIREGQEVLVTIDAFPQEVFRGSVVKIYPIVNPQQQSLRVDALLTDSIPGFYSGLAVEANIVIRKTDKAIVIPKKALRGDTLQIDTEDGVKSVKVKTGIQTFDEVEVVQGLDSNSQVVVPE